MGLAAFAEALTPPPHREAFTRPQAPSNDNTEQDTYRKGIAEIVRRFERQCLVMRVSFAEAERVAVQSVDLISALGALSHEDIVNRHELRVIFDEQLGRFERFQASLATNVSDWFVIADDIARKSPDTARFVRKQVRKVREAGSLAVERWAKQNRLFEDLISRIEAMPAAATRRIALVRKMTPSGSHHAYFSPDLRGFYVTGETDEAAREEAMQVAKIIGDHRGERLELLFPEIAA